MPLYHFPHTHTHTNKHVYTFIFELDFDLMLRRCQIAIILTMRTVSKPIHTTLSHVPNKLDSLLHSVFHKHLRTAFLLLLLSYFPDSWTIFSLVLQTRQEFLNVMNLAAIDVLSVRLRLDRNVNIPKASNACFGFDDSCGWTFFDLNAIYDEYKDEPVTVLEANFYHANQLLPLKDDQIVAKVMSYLSKCIKEFEQASVLEKVITRLPKSATHFFPGSYNYMMRGSTTFPNLFMAGDWIINRHGSWSQEKAYVSGLEAANRVIDYLGEGNFAKIIAVEEDEPHFQTLRSFNRSIIAEIRAQLPLSDFFL